jgi:hypothetical protein
MVGFRGLDWVYDVTTHNSSMAARARQFKRSIALATSPRSGEGTAGSRTALGSPQVAVRLSRRPGHGAQRLRDAKSSATGILNPMSTRDENSPLTL